MHLKEKEAKILLQYSLAWFGMEEERHWLLYFHYFQRMSFYYLEGSKKQKKRLARRLLCDRFTERSGEQEVDWCWRAHAYYWLLYVHLLSSFPNSFSITSLHLFYFSFLHPRLLLALLAYTPCPIPIHSQHLFSITSVHLITHDCASLFL